MTTPDDDLARFEAAIARIDEIHAELAMLRARADATDELIIGLKKDIANVEGFTPHTLISRIDDFEAKVKLYRTNITRVEGGLAKLPEAPIVD